jgi:hypothetical protein
MPAEEKPAKILRVVRRACDMDKPTCDQWTVVQLIDTGLVVGNIGPSKGGGITFCADGTRYLLTAQALREIADFMDTHGLELAS